MIYELSELDGVMDSETIRAVASDTPMELDRPVFDLDGYTDFLADFLPRLRPDIVVQRLFGVAEKDLLIAPDWGLPKAAVQNHLDKELTRRGVVQGSLVR